MIRRLAGLRRDWRAHLALAATTAVAAATIAGALALGDSVRGSLRASALDGLGAVTHLVRLDGSFDLGLVSRVHEMLGDGAGVAPLALGRGSVSTAGGATASAVDLLGVDAAFLGLFALEATASPWNELLDPQASRATPPVVIDETLAGELGVARGDTIVVSMPRWSDLPAGSVLARRDAEGRVRKLRCRVVGIVPERGVGRFALAPGATPAPTMLLPLAAMARALDRPGRADTLALAIPDEEAGIPRVASALRTALSADDLGLSVEGSSSGAIVASREVVMRDSIVDLAEEIAATHGLATRRVVTGLANRVRVGGRSIGYATVSALTPLADPPSSERLERTRSGDDQPRGDDAPAPEPMLPAVGTVLIEESTAERLDARAGDSAFLEHYRLDERDRLVEDKLALEVAGRSTVEGIGGERDLAPTLPGIADAATIAEWDPPFPIDLSRVTDEDEAWWDERRATPKLFVAYEDAVAAWGSRWGATTSVRLIGDVDREAFARELAARIPLEAIDATPRALRSEALARSAGSTDFSGLFVGFGSFLAISALLLVALLFGLLVARRGEDSGLLLAVGWPAAKVRRLWLFEGAIVATLGALAGAALAIGWAKLLLSALGGRWNAAIGDARLALHVEPASLAIGFLATLLLAMLALALALRGIGTIAPLALLRGAIADEPVLVRVTRARRITAIVLGLAAVALAFIAALRADTATGGQAAVLAFGAGAAALAAGVVAVGGLLRGRPVAPFGGGRRRALLLLGLGAARRAPRRATLLVGLVAASSFVLLMVAAAAPAPPSIEQGAAGYELIAEATVPLPAGLDDAAVRADLGMGAAEEAVLGKVTLVPLRLAPGDDVSCLSLGRPVSPRVLGVPPSAFADRSLPTRATLDGRDVLELLDSDLEPGVVPALGDADAVTWILRSGIGRDLELPGTATRLRIVGLLEHSAFQGELIVSERHFATLFPELDGFGALLVDVPDSLELASVATALERPLADFGLDATATANRLEAYRAVTMTWLATFRALGGLGVLLGVLGVAALIVRAGVERKRELDALAAFGWRERSIAGLLVLEHGLLIGAGLGLALAAALLATVPASGARALTAFGATVPVLVAIGVVGIAASALAARAVARERTGR